MYLQCATDRSCSWGKPFIVALTISLSLAATQTQATPLTPKEIEAFKASPNARVVRYADMVKDARSDRGSVLVYSNTLSATHFSIGSLGAVMADDVRTETSCGCDVTSYSVKVHGNGGGEFLAFLRIFDGCPGEGGTLIPNTETLFTAIPDAGPLDLTVDLSATPVPVGRNIWIQANFSTANAGVLVGKEPDIGFSADIYYHPFSSCISSFGGGLYASFAAQVYCSSTGGAAAPVDPTPADSATGVALDATLLWNELDGNARAQPNGESKTDDIVPPANWADGLQPNQPCATQEHYEAKVKASGGQRGGCSSGLCDNTSHRDGFIPTALTPFTTVRLLFHIFCTDEGTLCTTNQFELADQVATLNDDYLPHKIRFVYDYQTHNNTLYRYYDDSEESGVKSEYADSPETQLNVYIVENETGWSWGTFPWGAPLGTFGGIIQTSQAFCANCHILAHEVGHCIGLWHTHHGGSDEMAECGACWEEAGTSSSSTGDLCADTVPEPRQEGSCNNPGTLDPCSGMPWGTINLFNIMSYTADGCRSELTAQQAGRAHCWIDSELSTWVQADACLTRFDVYLDTTNPPTALICGDLDAPTCDPGPLDCNETYYWQVDAHLLGTTETSPVWTFDTLGGGDCNSNGIGDECEIADGSADDCNGNGIPDTCDTDALDCNSNGIPDDCEEDCQPNGTPDSCDISSGASEDCQPNGTPDECDIANGPSDDDNGNGVPDECEAPSVEAPATAVSPHQFTKNRYLSFNPNNDDVLTAFEVTLLGPDTVVAWVGQPVLKDDRTTDPQWVAELQTSPAGDGSDQVRDWSLYTDPSTGENVVHLYGCAVFPGQQYEIRTRDDIGGFSDPALFNTTPIPSVGTWADCVGTFNVGSGRWGAPNGITNFNDIQACLDQFQQNETNPVTWTDLADANVNYNSNFNDISAVIFGFQSVDFWDSVVDHNSAADCDTPAP